MVEGEEHDIGTSFSGMLGRSAVLSEVSNGEGDVGIMRFVVIWGDCVFLDVVVLVEIGRRNKR